MKPEKELAYAKDDRGQLLAALESLEKNGLLTPDTAKHTPSQCFVLSGAKSTLARIKREVAHDELIRKVSAKTS